MWGWCSVAVCALIQSLERSLASELGPRVCSLPARDTVPGHRDSVSALLELTV